VLDVACGSGRHLRLALERGYEVTGVDRNLSGVADLEGTPGVELVAADLEDGRPFPFRGRSFAGVIVTNYLWRPILPDIVACVAPDGLLIYETFAVGNERYGRVKNPEFLLKPGELIEAVRGRLVPIASSTASSPIRSESYRGLPQSGPITSGFAIHPRSKRPSVQQLIGLGTKKPGVRCCL
jgi:Methyltransferase domain.